MYSGKSSVSPQLHYVRSKLCLEHHTKEAEPFYDHSSNSRDPKVRTPTPKQGLVSRAFFFSFQMALSSPHSGTGTPLVSSTMIHFVLIKLPHRASVNPPLCRYLTKSLTPIVSTSFVCGRQTIQSVRAPGAALLRRNHLSTLAQMPDCIK